MRRWPETRAALIALVLFFWVIEALPLPMLSARHMRRDMAQEEVGRWVEILQGLSIEVRAEELVEIALTVSEETLAARAAVIKPFRVLERGLGMGQAWGLFTYADPYPGRLVIEATRGGNAWFPVYRAPNSDGSPVSQAVRHRRMRGVWDDSGDRPKPGKIYSRFARWVSGRVFEAHPDVQEVRVRLDRVTVRTPRQTPAKGPDKPRHIREHRRDGAP